MLVLKLHIYNYITIPTHLESDIESAWPLPAVVKPSFSMSLDSFLLPLDPNKGDD